MNSPHLPSCPMPRQTVVHAAGARRSKEPTMIDFVRAGLSRAFRNPAEASPTDPEWMT